MYLGRDSITEDANEESILANNKNLPPEERRLWNKLSEIANIAKAAKNSRQPATILNPQVFKTQENLKELVKITKDPYRKRVATILRFLNKLLCRIAKDGKLTYYNIDYYYRPKNFILLVLIAREQALINQSNA